MENNNIMLGHGSGGSLMHGLIEKVLLPKLGNPILNQLGDSALLKLNLSLKSRIGTMEPRKLTTPFS